MKAQQEAAEAKKLADHAAKQAELFKAQQQAAEAKKEADEATKKAELFKAQQQADQAKKQFELLKAKLLAEEANKNAELFKAQQLAEASKKEAQRLKAQQQTVEAMKQAELVKTKEQALLEINAKIALALEEAEKLKEFKLRLEAVPAAPSTSTGPQPALSKDLIFLACVTSIIWLCKIASV
jgi:hypothetical protein